MPCSQPPLLSAAMLPPLPKSISLPAHTALTPSMTAKKHAELFDMMHPYLTLCNPSFSPFSWYSIKTGTQSRAKGTSRTNTVHSWHIQLHDTVGSVRPRRDTQRLCSTLSHIQPTQGMHPPPATHSAAKTSGVPSAKGPGFSTLNIALFKLTSTSSVATGAGCCCCCRCLLPCPVPGLAVAACPDACS
jgi:hypothetical protein